MFDALSTDMQALGDAASTGAGPALFRDLPCSILITDSDVENGGPFIRYANPAFEAMTGWSLAEIQGRNPKLLQGPRTDRAAMKSLRDALLAGRRWSGATWNYRRNGEAFVMGWMISPFNGGWVAVQLELPAVAEAAIADSDGSDPLSYPLYLQAVERRLVKIGAGTTVCHIDIDGFFDATAGMSEAEIAGLSRAINDRLAAAPNVVAIARADADHYYALFDEPEAARGLGTVFEKPFGDILKPVRLSATIGAAVADPSEKCAPTLCHSAQIAVKRGKLDGRSRFVWHEPGMTADLQRRNDIERRLRRAIDNNDLSVAYQPKMNLKTGQIDSAEVLARWRDPVGGAVSPGEFIPVAESTGMIGDVSRQVAALAIADLARLGEEGDAFSIAINVSGYLLESATAEGFFDDLNQCVRAFGLSPAQIEIEITESKFLDANIAGITGILRKNGYKISIDDFGKDYSNLLQISNIEADTLKIDKSLVDFCDQNARTRAVIRSIVTMADELGMTVVAEGVETESQLNTLRDLGCTSVQGYLIARPGNSLKNGC